MFKKSLSITVIVSFFLTTLGPLPQAHANSVLGLPTPGTMVSVSPSFEPALIKGLIVHQDNPFLFDFIVDPGQAKVSREELKDESERMIKYFFAALTIPDKDIWVNLSPYEKDRMIPVSLGRTAMGRDLLAQDYMLKQLTASLIYPQKALGKTFWDKVYTKAKEMYGTTEIPVNTFNKVWIVPQKAGVYEHNQTAFIVSGHLKVMLEEDYLSMTKHNAIDTSVIARSEATKQSFNKVNALGSQIIRQIILPEIEKEINEGKNFATLRQIFYAQVLAVWFKRNLKQALLNRVYANKGTVKGIDQNDAATNEAIYHQYLRAYKKGVFNFIKEDIDPVTQETLPRKYFSGGYAKLEDLAMTSEPLSKADMAEVAQNDVDVQIYAASGSGAAAALTHKIDAATNSTKMLTELSPGQIFKRANTLIQTELSYPPDLGIEIKFKLGKGESGVRVGRIETPVGFMTHTMPFLLEITIGKNTRTPKELQKLLNQALDIVKGLKVDLSYSTTFNPSLIRKSIFSDAFLSQIADDPASVKRVTYPEMRQQKWTNFFNAGDQGLRNNAIAQVASCRTSLVYDEIVDLSDLQVFSNLENFLKSGDEGALKYRLNFASLVKSRDLSAVFNILGRLVRSINATGLETAISSLEHWDPFFGDLGLYDRGHLHDALRTLVRFLKTCPVSAFDNVAVATKGKAAGPTKGADAAMAISEESVASRLSEREARLEGPLDRLLAERANNKKDRAALAQQSPGGIDLSQQDAALQVTKDANGGVKVNVDPALIARVEREGMPEVVPVIINMQPADIKSLFGV